MQISIPPHSLFLLPSPHPAIFSSSLLPKHHVYFLQGGCDRCCRAHHLGTARSVLAERRGTWPSRGRDLACVPALGPPATRQVLHRQCVIWGTSAVVSFHFKLLWPPSTLVLLHHPIPASCRPLPSPFHSELRASLPHPSAFPGRCHEPLSLFFFFS